MAIRLCLALIVVVAFLLRCALLLPEVHADQNYLQSTLYGAWGGVAHALAGAAVVLRRPVETGEATPEPA